MTAHDSLPAQDSERAARSRQYVAIAIALLFAAAAAIRVHNAFGYWVNNDFDGPFNWAYVNELTTSWALPHPESHWSAARPPFFFYAGGVLARSFGPGPAKSVWAIRLASSAFGLLAIALAVRCVRREDPTAPVRAAIAALLLLFLPAHILMSAMLNEEITAASFTTLALYLALRDRSQPPSVARSIAIGACAGLALLTKLTGALVVVAIPAALALDGFRRTALRAYLGRAAIIAGIALVVGGWFYARSWLVYGYLYPHALDAHSVMLALPPGERSLLDYVRFPASTFTNPRVDSPDLLHSVWGGTYATLWFDGQRHFVPRSHPNVTRIATAILCLALLPTLACIAGAVRGLARAWRAPGSADAPMLALLALTLAGYVLFTWRNPWYVTVKGTYLLGLSLPCAYWASECLARWARGSRLRACAIGLDLGLLVLAVALAFTWGTPLWTMTFGVDLPGLRTLPIAP